MLREFASRFRSAISRPKRPQFDHGTFVMTIFYPRSGDSNEIIIDAVADSSIRGRDDQRKIRDSFVGRDLPLWAFRTKTRDHYCVISPTPEIYVLSARRQTWFPKRTRSSRSMIRWEKLSDEGNSNGPTVLYPGGHGFNPSFEASGLSSSGVLFTASVEFRPELPAGPPTGP